MTRGSGGTRRAAVLSVAAVAASAALAGCGAKAVPMDDDYAGGSEESSSASSSAQSSSSSSSSASESSAYRDGTYDVSSSYGPIREDSIDVHLTVSDGEVTAVDVDGHPANGISRKHQEAFAKAISGVVVGKPLKGLHVDTVAGASWTTEAFNKALDVARQEASAG